MIARCFSSETASETGPRFHFDEDELSAFVVVVGLEGHQIDFTPLEAIIPVQNPVSLFLQMLGGQGLAFAADLPVRSHDTGGE
jgi:hypothetical protein